eukprot:378555-Pelagomonas_calceolata.AAC.3
MDSSRTPKNNSLCNHASTTHPSNKLRINHAGAFAPVCPPSTWGIVSNVLISSKNSKKKPWPVQVEVSRSVHHVSVMCPSPFPFHSLFLLTAPLLAALLLTAVPLT